MKLNEVINKLKKEIDEISAKLDQSNSEFKETRLKRRDAFLSFYDDLVIKVPEVYKHLTTKDSDSSLGVSGFAGLSLLDRDQPFGDALDQYEGGQTQMKNITFDFKPPGEQFDAESSARSGGEKTIAGLSLIFAMAQCQKPMPPPMILLDEVDAHLDNSNVELLSNYISTWKGAP